MAGVVRLSTPHLISLGTGVSYGSGAFFGQQVNNLTNALHELQDTEAMKKLSEGDPETYLEYWKTRQKTATGSLKDQMATYADRATKKLAQMKEDSSALASYAKTNNHQKYLDFLLKRLDGETDPTVISKLGTQINELRSRVFSTSGGGSANALGGGVSSDEYNKVRDKWNETRLKYEDIVKSRPLTAAEYAIVEGDQKAYESTLKKIIFSEDATQTRKNQMNSEYLAATGPNSTYLDSLSGKSDAKLLVKFKSDTDFAAQIAPLIAEKNFGEVAKMYASRAQSLSILAHQTLNTPGSDAIGKWLIDAETKSATYASKASVESTKLPQGATDALDSAYSTYWSYMKQAHAADAKLPGPIDKTAFLRQLKADTDAATFSTDVGRSFSDATFQSLKTAQGSFGPADFNSATNKYEGDPVQVKNAQDSQDAIRILMNTPGSEYEIYKKAGLTDPLSIQLILKGSLTPEQAQAVIKGPGATYPGGPDQTAPSTQGTPGLSDTQAGGSTAGVAGDGTEFDATAGKSPQANDATDPSGKPAGGLMSMQTPSQDGQQEADPRAAAVAGVDTFLTQSDIGDLPDWKKPEKDTPPDVSSFFPFDNTPPPQVNTAPQYSDTRSSDQRTLDASP